MDAPKVIVVEADPEERDRFGDWLESDGCDVIVCPGPSRPEYTCLGARGRACPLAEDADVVVLDMSLESEAAMLGTPAEELLGVYLSTGHRVVVLGSRRGEDLPGLVRRLRRHPERAELVGAVRSLTGTPAPGSSS